ncbi:MAG: hypothetical protein M3016_00050 [Actinomycetota bacterium]|nr:hypothetical protein [Actinomycetota bacterium]
MDLKRRGMIALLVTGSMAGGALGATVLSAAPSGAETTSSASARAAPGPPGPRHDGGKFVSNENAGHEKGESAQREAQETAGRFPTVP